MQKNSRDLLAGSVAGLPTPHASAAFHRPGACGRGLLLASLLGLASAGAPFEPPDVYGPDTPAFFRQRRVREIEVTEQALAVDGTPGPRLGLRVEQLDRQGRVQCVLSAPTQGRLQFRQEYTYGPTGQQTDVRSFGRADDPADTTRRGRAWLPHQHTHWAPRPAGTGFTATWNPHTGDWQRATTTRRWTRHDTTYELSYGRLPVPDTSLTRSYDGPGGLHRYDQLRLQHRQPWAMRYYYFRQQQGRQVEAGMLRFDEKLDSLLSRQRLTLFDHSTPAYRRALDNLARHSQGHPQWQSTRRYDSQGRLAATSTPAGHTIIRRNAQGQVSSTEELAGPETRATLTSRTTFAYQPDGLVARQQLADAVGRPTHVYYFVYRYY